jgi:L-histidine N-alpha-methyltransferase
MSSLRIEVPLGEDLTYATIAEDVRRGLGSDKKELPSKYFYDARGSLLFEAICELPEYYLTRVELELLESAADAIVDRVRPCELVELGPGSPRKARILLDAMARAGTLGRYVPIDVSRSMIEEASRALLDAYRGLEVLAIVGDFQRHLGLVPRPRGRRLVAFLGSTLGNLDERDGLRLVARVGRLLGRGDRFLLGCDLLKDRSILEPAYDDSRGVTAEFNRNILRVVNRHLRGDLAPELFDHVARFDERGARIEMHLRARVPHASRLEAIDLDVSFERGETIRTEISRKWTRASVEDLLDRTGLALEEWITDERARFSLSLVKRAD